VQSFSRTLLTEELEEDGYRYHMPFHWIPKEEGDVWRNSADSNSNVEEHGLKEDRDHLYKGGNNNQVEFAACFIQHPYDNFEDVSYTNFPCTRTPKLLLGGLEIGAVQKSMFVSAEAFDKSDDDGIKALAAYLSIFDEAIVVAVFYRRYFEWWLPSLDNELRKHRHLDVDKALSDDVWVDFFWNYEYKSSDSRSQ
jgi:hypothetical protein